MSPSPKRKRDKYRTCTLTQKLEIIEMRDNGATWTRIAFEKGLHESTVRGIYAKKDQIRSQGKILLLE